MWCSQSHRVPHSPGLLRDLPVGPRVQWVRNLLPCLSPYLLSCQACCFIWLNWDPATQQEGQTRGSPSSERPLRDWTRGYECEPLPGDSWGDGEWGRERVGTHWTDPRASQKVSVVRSQASSGRRLRWWGTVPTNILIIRRSYCRIQPLELHWGGLRENSVERSDWS